MDQSRGKLDNRELNPTLIRMSDVRAVEAKTNAADPQASELAIVIPTFNERENIGPLLERLEAVLDGIRWEIIFVDDDSPDGTANLVRQLARRDPRIRVVHRIGRRGLTSACVECILSSSASYFAVTDADMQHDETLLPRMLERLKKDRLDLVIGSRYYQGGSVAGWNKRRRLISW